MAIFHGSSTTLGPKPNALSELCTGCWMSLGLLASYQFSCVPLDTLVPEPSRLGTKGRVSDLPTHELQSDCTACVRDEYRGL